MKRIFVHEPDAGASTYYRGVLPVRNCQEYCRQHDVELVLSKELTTAEHFDVYLFHRIVRKSFLASFMPFLKKKAEHAQIWWDLDDDFWSIPTWNPATQTIGPQELEGCEQMLDIASRILVTTEPLGRVVNKPDKVRVVRNRVDLNDWQPVEEKPGTRVLWAGSHHHEGDLNLIIDPLTRLMKDFPEVEFCFMGDMPQSFCSYARIQNSNLAVMIARRDLPNLRFITPVQHKDYHKTLTELAPTIGLAPLTKEKFNESKSNIKYLEYTLAGAASVCTKSAPYESAICLGDMYTGVRQLLQDQALRKRIRDAAYEQVRSEWSWNGINEWHSLFTEIA